MAIRINRVYTRGGDDGTTALVGGERVPKDHERVAAYGAVDELNSVIGTVRAFLNEPPYHEQPAARGLDETLGFIQQELFDLGGELATPANAARDGMLRISNGHIERLEGFIDELQHDLQPLRSFILPGGGLAGAQLHLARTVCRRAERRVTALHRAGQSSPCTVGYLNRLSDLLFVQARWIACKTQQKETLWEHGLHKPARRSRRQGKRKDGT